ncbi:MAG TPA: TetR/AcrR family transcriptional regulator [Wenzhouxiangella sp.]
MVGKVMAVHEQPADACISARERLLACAASTFAKRGYAGASVADIAAKAEISKSTVFHHFKNKRALYLAVIETAAQDFAQTLETVLERTGPLDERLADFQSQHMGHILSNELVTELVLRELQKSESAETVHLVRDVLSGNFTRLVNFISGAQSQGLLNPRVDPSVAALTLISANVFFFQHRKVLKHLPDFSYAEQPQHYTKSVIDLIFNGLDGDTSK